MSRRTYSRGFATRAVPAHHRYHAHHRYRV